MNNTDRVEMTAAHVAEQAFEILLCQSRLLRCCWNTMRTTSRPDAEITFRLAAMMSTVGAALENVPELAQDASRASIDGGMGETGRQRGWSSSSLELDACGAVDLLSSLTVDPLWYPGSAELQRPYKSISFFWKELCDRLAACARVEPNYGVLGGRSSEISSEPERWFVEALTYEAGWLRRRSESFKQRIAWAWARGRLSRLVTISPFVDEITAVHSSGGRSLKFVARHVTNV